MAVYTNHALISNNSGTTTATYSFGFTATAGRLLVAIGSGPVTWSDMSGAGWTLQNSQVSAGGMYIWTKTSNGTETNFVNTHNGSGGAAFPTYLEVWEFPAGTTVLGTGKYHITGSPDHLATVGSLTGTWTFIVGGFYTTGTSSTATITVDSSQMTGATEQSNGRLTGTSDGLVYSSWYGEGLTGTTTLGGGFGAVSSSNSSGVGETMAIALRTSGGTVQVTKTLSTNWAVRSRITKSLATAWAVRTFVSKSLAEAWAVRTRVQKTLAEAWAVRMGVSKSLAEAWSVRTIISKSASTSWSVRTRVSKALATNWSVRVVVQKSLSELWNVGSSLVTVSQSLSTAWAVRARVQKSTATAWAVRVALSKSLSEAWAVRTRVQKSLVESWAVRSNASKALATSWAVRRQVAKSVAETWAVRVRTVKVLSTTWDVDSDGIPIIVQYEDTTGRVGTIEGVWNGTEVVPATVSVYYG